MMPFSRFGFPTRRKRWPQALGPGATQVLCPMRFQVVIRLGSCVSSIALKPRRAVMKRVPQSRIIKSVLDCFRRKSHVA